MTTLPDSSRSLRKTALIVGAILVIITVGSYLLGVDHLLGFNRLAMTVVLVARFHPAAGPSNRISNQCQCPRHRPRIG